MRIERIGTLDEATGRCGGGIPLQARSIVMCLHIETIWWQRAVSASYRNVKYWLLPLFGAYRFLARVYPTARLENLLRGICRTCQRSRSHPEVPDNEAKTRQTEDLDANDPKIVSASQRRARSL